MENRQIDELREKMQQLLEQQQKISNDIRELQQALNAVGIPSAPKQEVAEPQVKPSIVKQPSKPKVKRDLEQFIGENLISKIGILILVIGVGIGTKYAIDNQMVSPLTRIILGYILSGGLLGLALFLRKKYVAFSAVLLSGSLAIMYLLTFSAYSFYGFLDKGPAFALMIALTVSTVYAALQYDQPIIGHLGLVGSYAIPFLLSDGSGQVLYLLIYMTIINAGILAVSIKKYWQSLHYAALIFTWLIVFAWFLDRYTKEQFVLAISFSSIYFLLFYVAFLANKVIYKKAFVRGDIFLLLSNSLIFYSLGFVLIDQKFGQDFSLGGFTLANALIHFAVALLVKKQYFDNLSLFRFIVGIGITYITLTIPVVFDGAWITVLWTGEAVALTWAGLSSEGKHYQRMSYALILLAVFSLINVWVERADDTSASLLINKYFMVSMISIIGFGAINWMNYRSQLIQQKWLDKQMGYLTPGIFLLCSYTSFLLEIIGYWDGSNNPMSDQLQNVWVISYSLGFLSAIALINWNFIQNTTLSYVLFVLAALILPSLLLTTDSLNDIREYYLGSEKSYTLLVNRYVLFILLAILTWSLKPYFSNEVMSNRLKTAFEVVVLLMILWVSSIEMVHWLDLSGFKSSDKLSLSILWGISALIWIGIGMNQQKKHFRVSAIVLFAVALLKLFFYDISHLNNLSKTVVFVVLGLLMLVASYLYNRFMQQVEEEKES